MVYRCERGQALVELAVILCLFVAIGLGLMAVAKGRDADFLRTRLSRPYR